jgi:hypothetical protein
MSSYQDFGRADDQLRESIDNAFASVLANLTFMPSGILTYLFAVCSPSAFGFVTMIFLRPLTTIHLALDTLGDPSH